MATQNNAKMTIGIQRPGAVDNIDIGPLISELTVEPWELTQGFSDEYHSDGTIEISVERTHEWEYLLIVGITGGGVFLTAVLKALGDRFGHWIADQVGNGAHGTQEIKITTDSGTSVTIPIDQIDESADEISLVLEEAHENQVKVIIEM
jgi:hypothetical protein